MCTFVPEWGDRLICGNLWSCHKAFLDICKVKESKDALIVQCYKQKTTWTEVFDRYLRQRPKTRLDTIVQTYRCGYMATVVWPFKRTTVGIIATVVWALKCDTVAMIATVVRSSKRTTVAIITTVVNHSNVPLWLYGRSGMVIQTHHCGYDSHSG